MKERERHNAAGCINIETGPVQPSSSAIDFDVFSGL